MMNEISRILLSDTPLAISENGYRYLLALAYPEAFNRAFTPSVIPTPEGEATVHGSFAAGQPLPAYRALHPAPVSLASDINLTTDYSGDNMPDASIAYYPIIGPILSDSYWRFSTKRFERDLLDAEDNPQIVAHLLHVNSPGGEAYYLDRLGETMDSLRKPIVAIIEEACSAAYNIACHAQVIYATTQFDLIGCIGTMVSFYDYSEFYASMGIKRIEAKADKSDLKNKTVEDLIDGKPEKFITSVLNPMNEAFLSTVRAHRPALAKLKDDHPALRGETFFTDEAISIGLIDARSTLADAAAEAKRRGLELANSAQLIQQLYKFE